MVVKVSFFSHHWIRRRPLIGPWGPLLTAFLVCSWYPIWQEARREETEDVYEILKRPNLPPHPTPHKYYFPPCWDAGPIHSSPSLRMMSEAGSPRWQHLQMHQALRNSAGTRHVCCFMKSWTKIDQEHYKEKRSVNLPPAIQNWISFLFVCLFAIDVKH